MSSVLSRRGRTSALVAIVAALSLGFTDVALSPSDGDVPLLQLVTVDTPTRAHKAKLQKLGLDVTEHAGHDFIEVVLHTPAEAEALRAAGFTWTVRIPDMIAREAEIQEANRAYAAATVRSPLPSGRDGYRTLGDYEAELQALATTYPKLAKHYTIGETLEGKQIHALEVGSDVRGPERGRPVFAMFGLHHAREWPSGEHTIEFAYDLLTNYGQDPRITTLLDRSRVIFVPVVNPDGFQKSVDQGMLVDLREVDRGGTVSLLGTPGNAYKRKNCRIEGMDSTPPGVCDAAVSPGGFGMGVDLNRNYGALWGGPGAASTPEDPTYRGSAPFSEPETQAIRNLVSRRQVTTLITNHTFSNLVLRPIGVGPDTSQTPIEIHDAPDEQAMKALGAKMAANNGYRNIHGWQLYDTTGTTEDWSYNATGGYGYTFEIGPHEFHPPYPEVIDEYLGAGPWKGKGNREAYLVALQAAVNPAHHSVLYGKAPAGATLRLTKSFDTSTWDSSFEDALETSMVVRSDGKFWWHVNPSTRPEVMARRIRVLADEPVEEPTVIQGGPTEPLVGVAEHEFVVERAGIDIMRVNLDWPVPDDFDLYVYYVNPDGRRIEVGSSGNFPGEKEEALIFEPVPGTYILEVHNFASVSPTYTLTVSQYDVASERMTEGLVEAWTLTCEVGGEVRLTKRIVVDRGAQQKLNLGPCHRRK